jgi:NPCBM/NEW2 domain
MVAIACLGLAASGRAQSALPLAFPIAESPFPCQLAGIDREWNLTFKTAGKLRVTAAADFAYWGRYRDVETGPHVILADGGVVHGDLLLLDDKQLIIGDSTGLSRTFWDESSLPRDCVRALLLQPPAGALERDRISKKLVSYSQPDDRLLLVGGETIAGTIASAPRAGRFAPEEGTPASDTFQILRRGSTEPLAVAAAKVVAVSFGFAGADSPTNNRASVWLGTSDGSLVRAASVSVRGDVVTVSLAAGGDLKTTLLGRDDPDKRFWDAITYVEPTSPHVTWLSDQQPLGYKHIPFVSVERPFGADQNVLEGRLRAAGGLYRKGLGMPSASRLAYDAAGYRKFEAEIAIDEAAELDGSVVFKVLLEAAPSQWKTAYESPVIRGGDPPLPVSIDLKGAARLALLVEFADRGDECDYADWLSARLIK